MFQRDTTAGPQNCKLKILDALMDYESLTQIGSIMDSGSMVVMDEYHCRVVVARHFIELTHSESCGKYIPRLGGPFLSRASHVILSA